MAPKAATKKPTKPAKPAPKQKAQPAKSAPKPAAKTAAAAKTAKTSSPVPTAGGLGTKRQCPKCSSKFYDFSKPEIFCPKCGHEIDLSKLIPVQPPAPPKPPPRKEIDPEVATSTDNDFESLENLGGDDDVTVEGITADDDSDDES